MASQVERTHGKEADCAGEAGLAEWETKDSKLLAVKYYGDCDIGRNSLSHRRVSWKVGLQCSGREDCSLSDPSQGLCSNKGCPVLGNA